MNFLSLLEGITLDMEFSNMIGEPAPDFSLVTPKGREVNLEELRGKPVLLNFWATWCEPCIEEMPLLVSTSKEYKSELTILAINEGDSLSDVKKFIKNEKLKLTVLLDKDEKIGDLYELKGYPTSVFIDEDGIIQAIILGELSEKKLNDKLELIGIE